MASPISTTALKPGLGEKDSPIVLTFQVLMTLVSVVDRSGQRKGQRLILVA